MRDESSGRPADAPPLRIVLVDSHEVSRSACRALLRTEGVDVVADLPSGDGVITAVTRLRPDAVIVDARPGDDAGLVLAGRLRALGDAPVVILTSSAAYPRLASGLDEFPFVAKADLCAARISQALGR